MPLFGRVPDGVGFVDPDFDALAAWGSLETDPISWGIHDGDGVLSDNPINLQHQSWVKINKVDRIIGDPKTHYTPPWSTQKQIEKQKDIERQQEAGKEIARQIEATRKIVINFQHATPAIAEQTAINWYEVGEQDAARRGIDFCDWIWKRSRFLAGFR